MTSYIVFFLLSSLPVTISYKYFTFLRSTIFNLAFSFPFKKPWLSILEVKVTYCSILNYSFKIFSTTVKPCYTVQLSSRGFKRYAVWKRYIASLLINRRKGLN